MITVILSEDEARTILNALNLYMIENRNARADLKHRITDAYTDIGVALRASPEWRKNAGLEVIE